MDGNGMDTEAGRIDVVSCGIGFPKDAETLGLIGRASIIHAHAGLRRVVETPFDGMIEAAPRWRLQK